MLMVQVFQYRVRRGAGGTVENGLGGGNVVLQYRITIYAIVVTVSRRILDLCQGHAGPQTVYSIHLTQELKLDVFLKNETRCRDAAAPVPKPISAGLSIAIAGSGGTGVMTAGTLLLDAAAQAGLYGMMVRTSGPQIRGGEAAAMLRLGAGPVESLDDSFDLLLAIGWQNVHRFADEIPLHAGSIIIGDAESGEVPEVFLRSGARSVVLPLKKMAKSIPGSWINMLALGLSGALAGLSSESMEAAVSRR